MCVATPAGPGWRLSIQPVGDLATLLPRLVGQAGGQPVALGVDFPLGLPRGFAGLHAAGTPDFPSFLRGLATRPGFFHPADTLDQVTPARPFYPRHGLRGMTRASHAAALGLDGPAALSRACDRATALRPAGAPLFWTLGANQSGKAAISGWRDLLLPALGRPDAPALWPFAGPLLPLVQRHRTVVAETYPAEALRQLGLRPVGSKRRQADRAQLMPGIAAAMARLSATADAGLDALMNTGMGADAAGEDRLDCLLGVLCVVMVLRGDRPDAAPDDPAIRTWEGWVLGQSVEGLAA